jgi:hypothetical protein
MMQPTKIILLLVLFMFCGQSVAVYGENALTFDASRNIFTGRVMGMGGAHVALSDDGEGLFTNPSGLAMIKFPQLVGMSRRMILDEVSNTVWGWALPTDWGVFGIGYSGSVIGDSLQTMRDPGNNRIILNPSLEAISYQNSSILLVYAKSIPGYNLALGGCLKSLSSRLHTANRQLDQGAGINLDLSASYLPYPFLNLGANAQNLLSQPVSWSNSSERLGGFTKLGAALKLLGVNSSEALYKFDQNLIACVDIDWPHDTLAPQTLLHFGLEWEYYRNFFIRGGINQRPSGYAPAFGIGLVNSGIRFDYAYTIYPGMISDNPHYFSLSYIGDRVFDSKEKLKSNESDIKFLSPEDRSVTSSEVALIKAEPKGKKAFETTNTWKVLLIETTSEVLETSQRVQLTGIQRDGYPIAQSGTIEFLSLLDLGRNVIAISGYVPPENTYVTDELRILRVIPFSDLPLDHKGAKQVELFAALGLVDGYPNHTFQPEKTITRAELAALLIRTEDISPEKWEQAENQKKFRDTVGKWSNPYANLGSDLGYFNPYSDNTFRPEQPLTRAEAITILVSFAKINAKTQNNFADIKPDYWASSYIQAAKDAGWLNYLEGNAFNPDQIFTRREAVLILSYHPVIQRKTNDFWDYGIINEPEVQ